MSLGRSRAAQQASASVVSFPELFIIWRIAREIGVVAPETKHIGLCSEMRSRSVVAFSARDASARMVIWPRVAAFFTGTRSAGGAHSRWQRTHGHAIMCVAVFPVGTRCGA